MPGVPTFAGTAPAVTSFWCLHPNTLGFLLCTTHPWAASVLGCESWRGGGGSRGRGTVLANRMRSQLLVMLHEHLCRASTARGGHSPGDHIDGENAVGGSRSDGDSTPTGFLSVSPSHWVGMWRWGACG